MKLEKERQVMKDRLIKYYTNYSPLINYTEANISIKKDIFTLFEYILKRTLTDNEIAIYNELYMAIISANERLIKMDSYLFNHDPDTPYSEIRISNKNIETFIQLYTNVYYPTKKSIIVEGWTYCDDYEYRLENPPYRLRFKKLN